MIKEYILGYTIAVITMSIAFLNEFFVTLMLILTLTQLIMYGEAKK